MDYIWKLAPVVDAEGTVNNLVDKAKRAKLTAIWVKVADGASAYANVTGAMAAKMTALVARAHSKGLQVWGWQVPHCATAAAAKAEATAFGKLATQFDLDGLIMDAEGGSDFFHGGLAEAGAYGTAMRAVATA